MAGPKARVQLEQLCKYLLRPGIAAGRIAETEDGRIEVRLKSAWKDGTTSILLKPQDFLLRLCALIPLPRRQARCARILGAMQQRARQWPHGARRTGALHQ
ncbi:MAG: transposase, partial [Deltaproteobacteria bacterium]|nr:transposase [Deltaproteobacteria bacterium]